MSFRVSSLLAAAVVLGASSLTPVSAQPQAPIRPRTSPFSSIFTPGLQQQQFQQQLMLNQALGVGGVGAGFMGPGFVNPGFGGQVFPGLGGIGYPGQLTYPSALTGGSVAGAALPPSGIVGTFNNHGHWYNFSPNGGGYYGHWYPNGVANGRGVLSGGGGGGGFVGGAGPMTSGTSRMGSSMIGNVGGTALGVGAMMNQFRR